MSPDDSAYGWEREEARRARDADPGWEERPSEAELALDEAEYRRRAEDRRRRREEP